MSGAPRDEARRPDRWLSTSRIQPEKAAGRSLEAILVVETVVSHGSGRRKSAGWL